MASKEITTTQSAVGIDDDVAAKGAQHSDSDSIHTQSSALVAEKPAHTWRSYFWDTFDKSREERRFLFKLDAVVLTFASLGYFIKNLDQINVNNAFVSGMKEDLGLYGNQLNYMITCWTVVVWSVLTILLSKCQTAEQIYVLRFFIGLCESTFYPGMQYVIGNRKDELAKRSCIFHASGTIGSMFSGYLMTGVYSLGGRDGFRGWQWLFIVNTAISLPIAVAGFFFFPDVPEITSAWWLTKDEIELAKKRMQLEGRANRGAYTKAKFRKIFTSWHIYALTLLYIFFNNGTGYGSQPAFALWLKDEGYSVAAINSYPTIASAIAVIFTYIYAWTSDTIFRGARWPPMVFSGVVNIITNTSLAVWDIPTGWKWFCYIIGLIGGGISGLTFAWAHEICSDDNEERALVVATMNEMAYVVQSWLPLIIWQQVDGPQYHKGFITMVFIAADVAVIGAGISGVASAAHLLRAGFNVTVFERTGVVGGVWNLEPRADRDPPFPNVRPPDPNWEEVEEEGLTADEVELIHGPPNPCYAGLKNNIPTPIMRSSLLQWPDGSEDFVDQKVVHQYIKDIAQIYKVVDKVIFHTRVESVSKPSGNNQWDVVTSTFARTSSGHTLTKKSWKFDAVVVASGHYHIPFVPDVPGLATWKQRFPDRVTHSKRYRTPAPFANQTVLVIGAGVSALDIANETAALGAKVIQSRRQSKYDLLGSRLREGVERVAMAAEFILDGTTAETNTQTLESGIPIPGKVVLEDGKVIEGIDHVVIATGYITSYPFLGELEQPLVPWQEADEKVITTSDGYITHNLHKDVFYIPDPSLAFIGVSHLVSTFSLFDFQAQVVAKIFAGQAKLPPQSAMKQEHKERKARFETGNRFHSMFGVEDAYIEKVLEKTLATHDAMDITLANELILLVSLLPENKRHLRSRKENYNIFLLGNGRHNAHITLIRVAHNNALWRKCLGESNGLVDIRYQPLPSVSVSVEQLLPFHSVLETRLLVLPGAVGAIRREIPDQCAVRRDCLGLEFLLYFR
ncbi:MFS general substrate transporter [Hypoxylon sp. FL1150]|nr:MFS general substrate transporter [Hypoxylon sp. FL1150]